MSKLEKADILEFAVDHLKTTQNQSAALRVALDSNVLCKYRAGYRDAVEQLLQAAADRVDADQLRFLRREGEAAQASLAPSLARIAAPDSPDSLVLEKSPPAVSNEFKPWRAW